MSGLVISYASKISKTLQEQNKEDSYNLLDGACYKKQVLNSQKGVSGPIVLS